MFLQPRGPSGAHGSGKAPGRFELAENRTHQSCSVFAVLGEDTYETFAGDGCYLYLESAFFAQSEAENRVSHINASNGYRGHLRKMTLELADGRFSIPDLKLEMFDHYSVEEVLDKLNQHVSNE